MLSKEGLICQNFQQLLLEKNNISNSIKIIGGSLKRKSILFEGSDDLRPTLGRIKETLFNWLGNDLSDKNCLDLFAGSGSLGFESISRGALSCTFIDHTHSNIENIQKNIIDLDLSNCEVVISEAYRYVNSVDCKYDLIFFDPPYHSDCYDWLEFAAGKLLSEGGIIYIESSKKINLDKIKMLKEKKTKSLYYGIYRL